MKTSCIIKCVQMGKLALCIVNVILPMGGSGSKQEQVSHPCSSLLKPCGQCLKHLVQQKCEHCLEHKHNE